MWVCSWVFDIGVRGWHDLEISVMTCFMRCHKPLEPLARACFLSIARCTCRRRRSSGHVAGIVVLYPYTAQARRTPPRMPRYFVRAPFSLQTPVERSERVAGRWAVRARANPLSLGVWHFTLRFVLPRSWVGYERLWHAVTLWTQSLPMLARTPRAPNYARVSLQ